MPKKKVIKKWIEDLSRHFCKEQRRLSTRKDAQACEKIIINFYRNVKQNYNGGYQPKLIRLTTIKKLCNSKCWSDCEEKRSLYVVCGNVNWNWHCGIQHAGSLRKTKLEQRHDIAISFLDLYVKKTLNWNDTRILTFNVACLTIAKIWKHPNCRSSEGWIKQCDTHIQWNIPQPFKRKKQGLFQQHGWAWTWSY